MRAGRLALAALLLAASPATAQGDLGSEEQRATGKRLYDRACAQCHGVAGDGQGEAAPFLQPRPRDFTSGKYKIRTTPSGALPTDEDMRQIIRRGMPYTSMPPWPQFTDDELQDIVYHLKTFSPEFAKADGTVTPLVVPPAPASSEASIAAGRKVYEDYGCILCHGELGRGDGPSAPTLVDDSQHPIRAADLTAKWTFRGGATRQDLFRTLTTGINGTPMPSYAEAISDEQRWNLVDYIYSLSSSEQAPYSELLIVKPVEGEIDLERGVEPFAGAAEATFPVIGQIVQQGRNFHPLVNRVAVRAVHSRGDIAFLLQWNDLIADTSGTNDPTLEVPPFDPAAEAAGAAADEAGGGEEDFWGDAAEAEPEPAGDDFWGEEEGAAAAPSGSEFSDAVALQLPAAVPEGIRKPYFLFGDAEKAVDLWFVDLAAGVARQFTANGSAAIAPAESSEVEARASYENGQWSVVLRRPLRSMRGVSFAEGQFLPVAFSVWDGFNEERGNKRGLTQWFYLYVEPHERPSALAPMLRAGLGILGVELLLICWLRWRHRREGRVAQARQAPA